MLDFTKLTQDMQGMSQHLHEQATTAQRYLDKTLRYLTQAEVHQEELIERQQAWRDRLIFTAAEPLESLRFKQAIALSPHQHTVCATDGSQLAPSHHEIAYCYLINIGRVAIHYGQSQHRQYPTSPTSSSTHRHPLLDSQPQMVYRNEDLYRPQQWGIRLDEWMSYRRTVAEATTLSQLAIAQSQSASLPPPARSDSTPPSQFSDPPAYSHGLPSSLPTLAMLDGSLIHWGMDSLPQEARDRLLPPLLKAWDQLQQHQIPLVGYISSSRSRAALNFLRFEACPHTEPDCMTHCPGANDRAPCAQFSSLRDTHIWTLILNPGERGPLWKSQTKILDHYGDHTIYFCHLHVGAEVARVEMPAWVAEDQRLLDTALTVTLAQVQKGYGYPVALAEAHNQAVVRGGDRTRFFTLLERQLVRAGVKNIRTSYKEARKRGSIA